MASIPLLPDSRLVTLPGTFPPAAAGHIAAGLLDRHSAHEIAEAVEVLVDLLDLLGGDPEAEAATWPNDIAARAELATLPDDCEPAGDEADTAWTEFHTRGRHKHDPGICGPHGELHEDDEATGDETDGDNCEDEPCAIASVATGAAGCPVADPGGCEFDGCEDGGDSEREQMGNDVPMLPVWSAEHNIFTDKRVPLGLSNLQSSFRANGVGVRSADTGQVHCSRGSGEAMPGQPI